MAEKNRSSAMAIVKEVTPGVPVAPSAGNQFIALQEGFAFASNPDQLENAEIRASIGVSKSIQGLENPTASFDHYLRHSGVEGQAPAFGPLVEAALGSTSANATERVTAAASTVSLLKLAAGGSDFARGKAVLVKDAVYSIRPVDSVAGDDLTLGFDLPTAPGASLGVGKCVNYAPVNESHPALSLWLYRGNGAALETITGARVNSMAISIAAGQLVNASFGLEGTKYYFDPVNVIAGADTLDFTVDDGTFSVTVAQKLYTDPHELAQALQDAMNASASAETFVVVYEDATGKYKFTSSSTLFSLLWNTGTDSIGAQIGFSLAADDTGNAGSVGYVGDTPIAISNAIVPAFDAADPQAAKNNEVLLGDSHDIACFSTSSMDITLTNEIQNVESVCAESGVEEKIFSQRVVECSMVAILRRYDADKFKKFRENSEIKFCYNFGSKVGGNWVPGKAVSIYMPTATVSSFELGDLNGVVTMEITVRAFVGTDGAGEFFINFL